MGRPALLGWATLIIGAVQLLAAAGAAAGNQLARWFGVAVGREATLSILEATAAAA